MHLHEVDLQVTRRCNLACDFCSVRAGEGIRADIPLESLKSLVDQAVALGMKELHLTGGEPTLRQDLEDLIAYASYYGVQTRIITNGLHLDRSRLEAFQRAGLKNIMVSLDGFDSTHDRMRGVRGSWLSAMNTVQDSLSVGLGTRVSSAVFQRNLSEIPELMKHAATLGVQTFSVFLGSPLGRGEAMLHDVLPPEQWCDFLDLLHSKVISGVFGNQMNIIAEQGFVLPEPEHSGQRPTTGRGAGCSTLLDTFDFLLVRDDGEVYQCVFFMHQGESLGNILESPLAFILQRAQKREQYRRFTEVPDGCRECSKVRNCGGGCRGYAMLYSRDWFAPDPRCRQGEKAYFPICPIAKLNLRSGHIGGSSEYALASIFGSADGL